ncbi:centromere protein U isoform X2 [Dunckerocampus dactyliophorus]|uniref:centromere protein U isoform X2 n=1 Tax=Dunckerocampus dactyliophorus TaxID=161453 RepID=UPI002404C07D|nr:centromere protein U isoform X2 [Dunckerocampus dactyliophorus]
MSTRKRRGAKTAPLPPNYKKACSFDSPNLSSIDGVSFIQGLQQHDGNRMHSTAIEEDLNPSKETQAEKGRVGKNNLTQKAKKSVKTRPKKSDTSNQAAPPSPVKPAKRRVEQTSAAGPLNDEQVKTTQKKRSVSGSGGSSRSQESDFGGKRRRNIILSSDEDTDKDTSWNPSQTKPKKTKMHSLERTRKTSSGQKASSGKDKDLKGKKKRKRSQGGTELEAMLDAFLDFCDEYRDSVASTAVKQSIDCFSNNVKEQLLEKIASCKELKALKLENAKVGSMIRTKTSRLLDAKHELIRAERQVGLLQKEKADLQLRLEDLKRSQSFLRDLRELNTMYLDYRRAHPKEKETYGASSLAALLLETKHIQGAEHQLRSINDHLEKKLKGN